MTNLKVKKYKAKFNKASLLRKLRPGRLSNDERLALLIEIGIYAQKKYKEYVNKNKQGYNLDTIQDGLQFSPDVDAFENEYFIDNGKEYKNKIAAYFENGTGLWNVKYKLTARKRIRAIRFKVMKFRKVWKGIRFAHSVKGVRPIYMLRRTLKSIQFNRAKLQRDMRFKLGI